MDTVVSADPPESICEQKQLCCPELELANVAQTFLIEASTSKSNSCPNLIQDVSIILRETDATEISNKMSPIASKDDRKLDVAMKEEADRNYESEPVPLKKIDRRKKLRNRANWNNQGRVPFARSNSVSKEMRELTRKHAILEKNLKIEGLPEQPPKFRKRRLSLSSNIGRSHDKDVSFKRKRLPPVDIRPRRDHMPKWELMGGDANDPLNLNGLAHSEEGRLLNLKTPESSPLPTPDFRKIVYVKVPPNIEDPLNLEGKHDQRVIDKMLNSTVKKRHRSKKKKNDDNQLGTAEAGLAVATQLCINTSAEETIANTSIIQPESQVIPEGVSENMETKADCVPTAAKLVPSIGRRSRSRSLSTSPERKFRRQLSGGKGKVGMNEPKKFPEKPKFTMGNYNRYYGYRNKDHVPDPRLQYFDIAWFKGKDVLDIGSNVGHITLAVAEQFQPHKILGMDIDAKLIQAARQNIRHMLSLRRNDSFRCPRVFEMTRGPLEAHPLMGLSASFPNNVLFLQGNYVPGSEEVLNLQKEEFDTILALSITKWIHLNNGDDGLKLFFKKIFRQLRPGGRLILEPQPWSTYRKRAKLSPDLFAKYLSIKLKPEGFKHYLLSIGFIKCEVIGVPVTKSKGFRRPLILFTKGDNRQTPNIVIGEDLDVRDVCQECGNTDKSLCDHAQFTGLRRGPYASHMYDHISYPYTSSDSPYVSTSRTYSNYSFVQNNDDSILNPPESDSIHSRDQVRINDNSEEFQGNNQGCENGEESDSSSSSSSESRSQSSSSSSSSSIGNSSSFEFHSSSESSRSYTSSNVNGSNSVWSGSSSYFSPDLNGLNGDIQEINNTNSIEANGGLMIELGHNGLGSENVHTLNSHEPIVPNADIADRLSSPYVSGPNSNEMQISGMITPEENIADAVNNSNSSELSEHASQNADLEQQSDDDDVLEVGVGDEHVIAEDDNQLMEPVHSNNSMNGDHTLNVVQHWSNDSQDANIDSSMIGQLPQT